MAASIPGVNNLPNKERRLSQVKVIRLRLRKNFASSALKMNGSARKEIFCLVGVPCG
jgi:hypothetical protein